MEKRQRKGRHGRKLHSDRIRGIRSSDKDYRCKGRDNTSHTEAAISTAGYKAVVTSATEI